MARREQVVRGRLDDVRGLVGGGLLITLVVGLIVGFAPQRGEMWNDAYRYVMTVERILGQSPEQAQATAIDWYCDGQAACVGRLTAAGGLDPNSAQYNEIFIACPGYPLLVAPFAWLFGLSAGLAVVSWLVTIAAGWLCLVLARVSGLGTFGSLASMAALYCLPPFFWLQQYLTEGLMIDLTLVVLIGLVLALSGRMRAGLIVSSLGYAAGLLVRYSSFSMLGACLAACLLLLALVARDYRGRRTYQLAAYNALAFVILTLIPVGLGWPGFRDSLTDTFTDHFTKPTPPDLYHHWFSLMRRYLKDLGQLYLHHPVLPLLVIMGLILLWTDRKALAAVLTAAALTGIGSALAHPVSTQGQRLYVQVFLVAVFGIGVAGDLIERRWRGTEHRTLSGSSVHREDEVKNRPQLDTR